MTVQATGMVGNQGDPETCQDGCRPPRGGKRLANQKNGEQGYQYDLGPQKRRCYGNVSGRDRTERKDLPEKEKESANGGCRNQVEMRRASRNQPEHLKAERHDHVADEVDPASRNSGTKRPLQSDRGAGVAKSGPQREHQETGTHAGRISFRRPARLNAGH